MRRNDLLEKTLMLGKTEVEMVGWHHKLNGHEFEQNLVDGGQGNVVCCSPLGHRVRHY